MTMMKLASGRSWLGVLLLCAGGASSAQGAIVYRCPGPPILYTDQITPPQAKERDCRTIEGTPITVVSPQKQRPTGGETARPTEGKRVDAGEQRARDADARKILEAELRREEAQLADLQKESNAGEPDRRGDERNYQRYLDRAAELKAGIARKEADIAAIRRELAKLGP
jgi:hypothetical protein